MLNVLSNNEIYILLKLIANKDLMNGLTSICKLSSRYSIKEFEHLNKEIALSEGVSTNDIMQIRGGTLKHRRTTSSNNYNLRIFKANLILSYATKYSTALAKCEIAGINQNSSFTELIKEFYLLTKTESDFNNIVSTDLKYMPAILFAYINNLISLDFRYENSEELENNILSDNLTSLSIQFRANGVEQESRFYINDTTPLNEVMLTISANGQSEEINADMLMEIIAKIKETNLLRNESNSNNNETVWIDKLKNGFTKELSKSEIYALRACKYLMMKDCISVTNKRISEYLTSNNFPISEGSLKQCTRSIKYKCTLPESSGGISSLVQNIELKGFIIPPLKPIK